MPKVVFIHTVNGNVDAFTKLADELMPGADPVHLVDESLLQDTIRDGALTDDVRSRFREHLDEAVAGGADVVMFTCSSVGPAADGLTDAVGVRVLRVDEAMAERAVSMGPRIGVAATLPTTLGPTGDLIRAAAARLGRPVSVDTQLATGAFQALQAGDGARHDELVRAALAELAGRVDVVVLAQASMARALAGAQEVNGVPVLTSPRLGVERLRDVVATIG
jgi:Asp/Glu/hydantoin racemase